VILYVNGDSHSAGAEAVNAHAFACDDPLYWALGRQPHPDNERVSYGCQLANMMYAVLHCDAESASSNHRIIRTTWEYLDAQSPDFVVIGWSTWERKEFYDQATNLNWQVNAGGVGEDWPTWLKDLYPQYISEIDWPYETHSAHLKIHQFHVDLASRGIRHLFFNTYNHFDESHTGQKFDWDNCYVDPYNPKGTYYAWCIQNGFKTVRPNSYHFGPDAHAAWAEFLYNQIVHNELTRIE
jgi:hypothetical protein